MKRKLILTAVVTATLTGLLSFMAMALFLRPTALDISALKQGE